MQSSHLTVVSVVPAAEAVGRSHVQRFWLMIVLAFAVAMAPLGVAAPASAQGAGDTLEQCRNGASGAPVTCTGAAWQNGNLNGSNSSYVEGEVVPFRLELKGLIPDASTPITISYDSSRGGRHAYDYLTSFNESETTADPCSGGTTCTGLATTFPIPVDGAVSGAGVTPIPGMFSTYGGAVTGATGYTVVTAGANDTTSITLQVTPTGTSVVIAWGGHISTKGDWGIGNSAGAISGSPYHMDTDRTGDRSINSNAVISPPSITVVKDTRPDFDVDFDFVLNDGAVDTPFTLTDDGVPANAADATRVFLNLAPGLHTVTETQNAAWPLSGVVCGGTSLTPVSPVVVIDLKAEEDVSCTFTNVNRPAITVVKTANVTSVPAAGDQVTYTAQVTNNSPVPVTVTDLTDTDLGDLLDGATDPGNDCNDLAAGALMLTASPGPNNSVTCDFLVTVNDTPGTTHVNTVEATATNGFSTVTDTASALVMVRTALGVTVAKSAGVTSVPSSGGPVTYTALVTNTSDRPVTVTSLTDTDLGDLLLAGPVDGNDCNDLAAGALLLTAFPGPDNSVSCDFLVTVNDTPGATHTNTVAAVVTDQTSPDTATGSDTADVRVRTALGVTVAKTAGSASVPSSGGPVTYTALVTNTSDRPVTVTSLTDTDLGNLLDAGTNPDDNGCNDLTGADLTLAPGTSVTCDFVVIVTGAPGSTHTNTVAVGVSDPASPDTASGSDTADVLVDNPPVVITGGPSAADLAIVKTVDLPEVGVGQTATFTLTVTNGSLVPAANVQVTDSVPDGLTVVSATPSSGSCVVTGQDVACALGSLAAGSTATVDIVVQATQVGTFTNIAGTTTSTGDPDVTNNTDSAAVAVIDLGTAGVCVDSIQGVTGISGATRIETAIQASQLIFCDDEAGSVVLTRSDLFPDAQAGTPLAILKNGPLLLSEPSSLNTATETEIVRILPSGGTVYLLGGTVALSQAVEDRLVELGYQIIRFGGPNRFGTAAIVADEGLGNPDTLLATNGGNFPDSVLAGAASLAAGFGNLSAVILTSGEDVPPETAAYLASRTDDPTVVAIGGPAARALPAVESVVGATRFDTSVAVAERFFTTPRVAGLATGLDFADALTGGAVIGRDDIGPGPMLLTEAGSLPAVVAAYLQANVASIDGVAIFGGSAVISDAVHDEVDSILSAG